MAPISSFVPCFLMLIADTAGRSFLCDVGMCDEGQFLNAATKTCEPCPFGTFLPLKNQACISCSLCTLPNEDEVIIQHCSASEDTVIGCREGFFMTGVDVPEARYCQACLQCENDEQVVRPCGGRQNTVCQKKLSEKSESKEPLLMNFSVAPTDEIHAICDAGPCLKGEYYNLTLGSCVLCENGTFIDSDYHRCHDCKPCSEPNLDANEKLQKPCTRTSNSVIDCQDGNFRTNTIHPECDRCTICTLDETEEEPCGPTGDTVCKKKLVITLQDSLNDHGRNAQNTGANCGPVALLLLAAPVLSLMM